MIPSELWDWMAVLVGLRAGEGLFIPSYWCIPATLTASGGWVPSPSAVLGALTLLSFLGIAGYVWRRRSGFLYLSCAVWGMLSADSPFAFLLPVVVYAVWRIYLRVVKMMKWDVKRLHAISWRRLGIAFVVVFLTAVCANIARCGVAYFSGYIKNALIAVRWDGGWHPFDAASMDELLDDYVTQLVRAAEGRKWIFTDGLCDSGIELAAARICRDAAPVKTLSLTEAVQGEDTWRSRGFVRKEDITALESGATGLLRAWALDRPGELTNAVFQCGFAFLDKMAASNRLEMCGLVLRSSGASIPEEARIRVFELAAGIVEFYAMGGKPEHGGWLRQARFCVMQWRVARAIRRHATELDRKAMVKEALAATELSEELDRLNPFAVKRDSSTEAVDLRAFATLSPREGLAIALSRANFALARRFAVPILKDHPNNAEANFAMAMSHLVQQEHAQARHYFRLARKARPDDAAILNNIAATSLALGDLEDAEENVRAALKLMPDSAQILDTFRKVQMRKAGK